MARGHDERQRDEDHGGPKREAQKVELERNVVAVAPSKALVSVHEAGPWRLAVVAGPREENIRQQPDRTLVEEVVGGCWQPPR
jgi:hypothetical protein